MNSRIKQRVSDVSAAFQDPLNQTPGPFAVRLEVSGVLVPKRRFRILGYIQVYLFQHLVNNRNGSLKSSDGTVGVALDRDEDQDQSIEGSAQFPWNRRLIVDPKLKSSQLNAFGNCLLNSKVLRHSLELNPVIKLASSVIASAPIVEDDTSSNQLLHRHAKQSRTRYRTMSNPLVFVDIRRVIFVCQLGDIEELDGSLG